MKAGRTGFAVRLGGWVAGCAALFFAGAAKAETIGAAEQLIDRLHMAKIPSEGAWFAVTYGSADRLPAEGLPARYGSARLAGTAIYALVTRMDFSAMHRLKTDEIWHFYVGDPIELLLLFPDGKSDVVTLGADVLGGERPQFTVPAGVWMGARPLKATPDAYALFGTTMAPGFDYADYEAGYREELQALYPERAALIAELTRAEFVGRAQAVAASETPTLSEQPTVFDPGAVPKLTVAPGVELNELAGRTGYFKTPDYSVARFSLAAGKETGTSYNKVGEEIFLVIAGRGSVVLGEKSSPVAAGAVVVVKPGVRHSVLAAPTEGVEFYAITVPAFSPDDYVRVK